MKTIIENVHIVTMDEKENEFKSGLIAILNDEIVYVGDKKAFNAIEAFKDASYIDGNRMIALPGFINAHTHTAMSLFRSYADDMPLWEWLTERIWPLEELLHPEDAYWLSLLSIAEMISSGTTTFSDMYMFMEHTMRAVKDSGIRGVLARGIQGTDENTPLRFQETKDLIKHHKKDDGRITVMIGPHAIYTCDRDVLRECRDLALKTGLGIHIHLAETSKEVKDCMDDYNYTPVELLEDIGLFDASVTAAHCVHLTDRDMEILRRYNVKVVHCPVSNMKLASGFAPIDKLMDKGICVSLGTDGAASNNNSSIFKEMSAAALIIKGHTGNPTAVPAKSALKMASINGAKALLLDKEIGSIEAGKKADIILIDTGKPHYHPHADIASNLVYGGYSADVDTVIINGHILYKNRQFTCLDLEKVYYMANKIKDRISN